MRRWLGLVLALTLGTTASGTWSWAAEAKTPPGQQIFTKHKCNSCHSIQAVGVEKKVVEGEEEETTKKKPPDLSGVGLKHKPDWIQGWLLKKETMEGEHHIKKFRGTEKELATLAAWLGTLKTKKAGQSEKGAAADSAQKAE